MNSLYCIRDAGGVRRYKTYSNRESAERAIDAEIGPGCRAPLSVVEFIEATPVAAAANDLLQACRLILNAKQGAQVATAMQAVRSAVVQANGEWS